MVKDILRPKMEDEWRWDLQDIAAHLTSFAEQARNYRAFFQVGYITAIDMLRHCLVRRTIASEPRPKQHRKPKQSHRWRLAVHLLEAGLVLCFWFDDSAIQWPCCPYFCRGICEQQRSCLEHRVKLGYRWSLHPKHPNCTWSHRPMLVMMPL